MKNIFEQQDSIIKEIADIQKRIDKIEEESSIIFDSVKGSSPTFPYVEHSIIILGYEQERNNKLNRLKLKLQESENKLIENTICVVDEINKIQDSITRRILSYRYIDKLKWIQIQQKLGYSSESAARMIHDRYLAKEVNK